MPSLPGINHQDAVRALQKAGWWILRQGRRHLILTNGSLKLTIPHNNPINAHTMGGIVRTAGLTNEAFRQLL